MYFSEWFEQRVSFLRDPKVKVPVSLNYIVFSIDFVHFSRRCKNCDPRNLLKLPMIYIH